MSIIRFIASFFNYDFGAVYLKHGRHEFFIHTCIKPRHVWVLMEGRGSAGCGEHGLNTAGWEIHEHKGHWGVKFVINVKTDTCKLKWVAR